MSGISYSDWDTMHRDYFAIYGQSPPPHPAILERQIQEGKWDSRPAFAIDIPDVPATGNRPSSEAGWRKFYEHTIEESIARDGRIPTPQTIKNLKKDVVSYTISQTSQRLRAEPEFHATVKEAREEAANPLGPLKRFLTGEKSPYDEAMTEGSYRHRFAFGIENDAGRDAQDFRARLQNPPSQSKRIQHLQSIDKSQPPSHLRRLKQQGAGGIAKQAAHYGIDGVNALTDNDGHLTKAGALVNHLAPAAGKVVAATAPAVHTLAHLKSAVLSGPVLPLAKAWNTNRLVSRDLDRQIEDCAVQAVPHHEAWFEKAADDVVERVRQRTWRREKKGASSETSKGAGSNGTKNRKK